MRLNRRDFLKISGASAALAVLGFDVTAAQAQAVALRIAVAKVTPTICPYCGSGCGLLIHTDAKDGKVLFTEGDPDHPINRGGACSKGSALFQLNSVKVGQINPMRLTKPLYRAPGADSFQEVEWEWAMEEIVKKIKETRDKTFVGNKDGMPVMRTEAIANMGGAALDNEELHILSKLVRALGIVYVEHQARICHSPSVPGLSASFGRGAMTNHFTDMQNTDVALVLGSNPFENHPITSKWLTKARDERGCKIICVDPRFTRTASRADIYAPMRSGTDIAFIGGMINYVLEKEMYFKDYVVNYTNAASIVDDGFDYNDGLFSGYNEKDRKYDQTTWAYKTGPDGQVIKDLTLQNPRCVFQLLKKHFARYDADTVCKITGTPKETYLEICELFASTGKPDKAGNVLYAMGITQHTVGTQNIRAYGILQSLLGNMGIPGGGVAALRGESNVQGSTDFALLNHIIPGYLNSPDAQVEHANLAAYLAKETPKAGFKVNTPKWMVSYLKAMWGPAATAANEFAYHYLPKKDPKKNHSHIGLFEAMYAGDIKGLMLWGQNPRVGGPNTNKAKDALKKLDWMVGIDLWSTETMNFWTKEAGEDPSTIQTEVFVLPACSSLEKEGTITNSGRWMQYRWKATEPVGESKADLEIIHDLGTRLIKAYAGSTKSEDAPIRDLFWIYGHGEECDIDKVAREINGYDVATSKQLNNFLDLKDDGSTICGCWIYSGFYPEKGNLAKRRDNVDKTEIGQYPDWAWCWPVNRRILYNRASADLDGKPWSEDKAVIWWNPTKVDEKTGKAGKWIGKDVPDFKATVPPNGSEFPYVGNQPFLMQDDGMAALFCRKSLKEGPFPEHYEPWETPVENLLNPIALNPVVKVWEPDKHSSPDKYPIVATTFRLTEHWQTGVMTRNLPWLGELAPEMFIEMSKELAEEIGINNGEFVIVDNARGEIKAKAMVTERFKPFQIHGKTVHHIGMPWHFGFKGYVTGAVANILTPHIGDGNTTMPEYKAFLVNVRRAG